MTIHSVDLPPLAALADGHSAAPNRRLAALAGVKAELLVIAGRAGSNVGDILSLKAGEVLALDRALNAPFDVMLGDSVIARGELVAVDDRFGVRIIEVAPGGPQP